MASWFRGIPGWTKAIFALSGGLIIGSITYYALIRRKRRTAALGRSKDGTAEDVARRILVLGLSGAGKSSFLSRLSRVEKEKRTICPTEGFNVMCLQAAHMTLNIWEIGGGEKTRPYWINFVQDTNLLVFVVDSADEEHIGAAVVEFHKLLADQRLRNVPVLLLANKQDLPHAKSSFDIEHQFGFKDGVVRERPGRSLGTRAPPNLPSHPSVWEAERMMITMSEKL